MISTLLYNAGLAALNMQQLEILALWVREGREACAVIYHRNRVSRVASLTWRGTWDLELGQDVVGSWQKIASESSPIWILHEHVADVINSNGDAIHHLRLPRGSH